MEILIISGLSGAGKSKAASYLEDMGFYIVDNMPAGMMLKFAEFCAGGVGGRYSRVALVYDVRTAGSETELSDVLAKFRTMKVSCRLLFLEALPETIIHRYKETRRSHPLCADGCSIETAVSRERELLRPVRDVADVVLDTSAFSTAKLRSTLLSIFAASGGALHVNVLSFGFKNGLPPEADLVLDVRFLPNPYYVPELKSLNGLDAPVRDYVFHSEQTDEFFRRLTPLLDFLLPQYRQEGRTELVIAVGCTGGRHRSVAVAHYLAEYVTRLGCDVTESHRDMTR